MTTLSNRTPWTNKAWRRQDQQLCRVTGLTLKGAMRRIAIEHKRAIPRWDGDWATAQELFDRRSKI